MEGRATSFFGVRLWSQKELLETLFDHLADLDEDLKTELPLKQIWTVAVQDQNLESQQGSADLRGIMG